MKKALLACLLAALAGGCSTPPPPLAAPDRGSTVRCPPGGHADQVVKQELSPDQLAQLRAWLNGHPDGWAPRSGDIPSGDEHLLYTPRGAEEIYLMRGPEIAVWIDLVGAKACIGPRARALSPADRDQIEAIAGLQN